jgi:hypothetical protein
VQALNRPIFFIFIDLGVMIRAQQNDIVVAVALLVTQDTFAPCRVILLTNYMCLLP